MPPNINPLSGNPPESIRSAGQDARAVEKAGSESGSKERPARISSRGQSFNQVETAVSDSDESRTADADSSLAQPKRSGGKGDLLNIFG
jgi:hypothetical protein